MSVLHVGKLSSQPITVKSLRLMFTRSRVQLIHAPIRPLLRQEIYNIYRVRPLVKFNTPQLNQNISIARKNISKINFFPLNQSRLSNKTRRYLWQSILIANSHQLKWSLVDLSLSHAHLDFDQRTELSPPPSSPPQLATTPETIWVGGCWVLWGGGEDQRPTPVCPDPPPPIKIIITIIIKITIISRSIISKIIINIVRFYTG